MGRVGRHPPTCNPASLRELSIFRLALLTGVFNQLADEFHRRWGATYEDRQIDQNGYLDF